LLDPDKNFFVKSKSFSRVTLRKNIWKDTHKWLDPDKQIVVKSMSFSRVTLRKNI